MSLNSVGSHLAQRVAHPVRLELEDPDRVAAREHLEGLGVVEGIASMSISTLAASA